MTETELSAEIKSGKIRPVYFFSGDEAFLIKTYVERIKDKVLGKTADDFNLLLMKDNPPSGELSLNLESLPVFAEKKLILLNDLNPDKLSDSELEEYVKIVSDVPDYAVLVIYVTGGEISKKSGYKKLTAAIQKSGAVCDFQPLTAMKIADLVTRKATRLKCSIIHSDAEYLAEITLCNMTAASSETAKLCAYVGEGGIITREIIDRCVAKQLDTSIYLLSDAITAGKTDESLKILDEFYQQRFEPQKILATLAGAFTDMYRAKLGKSAGISADATAELFRIKKNRVWVISKLYGKLSRVELPYIRQCILIISAADIKMKSSAVNSRTVMEQMLISLAVSRK